MQRQYEEEARGMREPDSYQHSTPGTGGLHLVGREEGGLSVSVHHGGLKTRVQWERLCSSFGSLSRARGWASVDVSSKLTLAKEKSRSLEAMQIPAPRTAGSRRDRGQDLPCQGDLYLTSFVLPCGAGRSASRPSPNPSQPLSPCVAFPP